MCHLYAKAVDASPPSVTFAEVIRPRISDRSYLIEANGSTFDVIAGAARVTWLRPLRWPRTVDR